MQATVCACGVFVFFGSEGRMGLPACSCVCLLVLLVLDAEFFSSRREGIARILRGTHEGAQYISVLPGEFPWGSAVYCCGRGGRLAIVACVEEATIEEALALPDPCALFVASPPRFFANRGPTASLAHRESVLSYPCFSWSQIC